MHRSELRCIPCQIGFRILCKCIQIQLIHVSTDLGPLFFKHVCKSMYLLQGMTACNVMGNSLQRRQLGTQRNKGASLVKAAVGDSTETTGGAAMPGAMLLRCPRIIESAVCRLSPMNTLPPGQKTLSQTQPQTQFCQFHNLESSPSKMEKEVASKANSVHRPSPHFFCNIHFCLTFISPAFFVAISKILRKGQGQ